MIPFYVIVLGHFLACFNVGKFTVDISNCKICSDDDYYSFALRA
jgi:hypothetical protein